MQWIEQMSIGRYREYWMVDNDIGVDGTLQSILMVHCTVECTAVPWLLAVTSFPVSLPSEQ